MSVSVPLITDPCDQLLAALPFVHARARNQCLTAVCRAFNDATGEQKSVQVMLHLATRHGPTLMEFLANVVRNESESCAILTGREVDSSLASLLHERSATAESAVAACETADDGNEDGDRSSNGFLELGPARRGRDGEVPLPANGGMGEEETASSTISSLTMSWWHSSELSIPQGEPPNRSESRDINSSTPMGCFRAVTARSSSLSVGSDPLGNWSILGVKL